MKLSQAFDFLEDIGKSQMIQSELAMQGLGEYELSHAFRKKFLYSPDVWSSLPPDSRIKAINSFFKAACHHIENDDFNITDAYRPVAKKDRKKIQNAKRKEKKTVPKMIEVPRTNSCKSSC